MNRPRCEDVDYIQFLVAAQRVFSCTEAARCQPQVRRAPAHDAFTRLLRRQPPDTAALWQEVCGMVSLSDGALVLDDTTLDKPHAHKMDLVTRHWSSRHKRVVWGINLITLLWTDGAARVPCDARVYDKPFGGETKNEHFRAMLNTAASRGFQPGCVLFDSWYSSLENLKAVREHEWDWLTRLKGNRRVNPEGAGNVRLETVDVPREGRVVHLRGYGLIKVFRTVALDGDAEYWATSVLDMSHPEREQWESWAWGIEMYHRGIKQCCGIERAQVRSARAQRNHMLLALRAFVRLEAHRLLTGVSWYEAKIHLIRSAIRSYLAYPIYQLKATA